MFFFMMKDGWSFFGKTVWAGGTLPPYVKILNPVKAGRRGEIPGRTHSAAAENYFLASDFFVAA